jgi:heat shock protein HslJ
VTVHGHSVTVGESTSTMKACPGSEAFDGAFARAFSGRLTADIDGRHLTLTGEDGDAIDLTYLPDAPLVGTEWTVNALVRAGTATGIPQGTDGKSHFTLGKNGTVEGNQGCNGFSGTAKVSGSTVTFSRSVSTAKLCSGPEMTLEREVGKVMEGRVAYELDHRTLTLTGPDGTGVSAGADGPARLK